MQMISQIFTTVKNVLATLKKIAGACVRSAGLLLLLSVSSVRVKNLVYVAERNVLKSSNALLLIPIRALLSCAIFFWSILHRIFFPMEKRRCIKA